jgi:hypothetical protein
LRIAEDDSTDEDPDHDQEVIHPQTFGREDTMDPLLLAIHFGLEYLSTSKPQTAPFKGTDITNMCVVVNGTGVCWANFPQTTTFNYYLFPGIRMEKLYFWIDLGCGSKGCVFLA